MSEYVSAAEGQDVDNDLPAKTDQTPLSADDPWPHVGLAPRGQTPAARSERCVERAAILNLGQVEQAIYIVSCCLVNVIADVQ